MVLLDNPYAQSMFAGLVAALVMSFGMIIARSYKSLRFEFYERLGRLFIGWFTKDKRLLKTKGLFIHLAIGVIWGLVYTYVVINLGLGQGWLTGLVFGLIPWLFMMLILLPILKVGIFGKNFNSKLRDTMLLFHLLYGLVLGIIAAL